MSLLVAVLGAGNIAQQHLPVLKALPECDLVSIVDTNSDTLTESADRFDIPNRYGSIAGLAVSFTLRVGGGEPVLGIPQHHHH